MAISCCFGLRGNLDFPDFLQKSFITSTTENTHHQWKCHYYDHSLHKVSDCSLVRQTSPNVSNGTHLSGANALSVIDYIIKRIQSSFLSVKALFYVKQNIYLNNSTFTNPDIQMRLTPPLAYLCFYLITCINKRVNVFF